MAEKKTTAKKAELSLNEQLLEGKLQLLEHQKTHAAGELVNPTVLRTTRKEIARLKTAIRAEEIRAKKESK